MFDVPAIVSALEQDVSSLAVTELPRVLRQVARVRAALDAFEAQVLARMCATKAHALDGAADPGSWLRNETGISAREANRRTSLATGLATLAGAAASLSRGAISAEHAEVLARAVARTPALAAREADLVAVAGGVKVEELARHVRRIERLVQPDQGASAFERQRARRDVRVSVEPSGGWRLGGFLDDVDGRLVHHAVETVAEDLWRRDHPDTPDHDGTRAPDAAQRRADALVEICRRALAVAPHDPLVRRTVPLVMVLIDHDTLTHDLVGAGVCELDDGTPLAPATARRLACEAGILPVVLDGHSQPLDLARTQRLATAAQRRALIARSGGTCETPGCTRAWTICDAHHLGPGGWDGGARTRIEELAWVCNHHHHLLHEGGATLTRHPDGSFTLTLPDGTTHAEPVRRRGQPRPRPTTHPARSPALTFT